jgi:uncharacterized membrane protein YqjE
LIDDANTPYDRAQGADAGPVGGLFRSLANLLATIVAIAHTRVELLTTEVKEEIHRAAGIMVWALVALLAAAFGLFLTALVIVFVFWDTHRVLASVLVASSFFVLAFVALLLLRSKVRHRPRPLEGTLAELAKDRDQLRRR